MSAYDGVRRTEQAVEILYAWSQHSTAIAEIREDQRLIKCYPQFYLHDRHNSALSLVILQRKTKVKVMVRENTCYGASFNHQSIIDIHSGPSNEMKVGE